MSEDARIFALVPAAGRSRRMGRDKLRLPLGSKSVLEHVVDNLSAAPVSQTLVVLGPGSEATAASIAPNAEVLILNYQTDDMRQTAEAGVEAMRRRFAPRPADGVVFALGDHPSVRTEVVDRLIARFRQEPGTICLPVFEGKRGHPALFPWEILQRLCELPPDQGVNSLSRRFSDHVRIVEARNRDVLEDVDTPDDYERLRRRDWH